MSKTNDEKVAKNNLKQAKKLAKIAKKSENSAAKNSRKNGEKSLVVATKKSGEKKTLREKVAKKLPSRKKNLPKLTNDTLDEYREKILAGGRKFKYPIQVSKHRILWISLGAVVAAAVIFAVWMYVALYPGQATDDFYYDVARVLPLPVANVDGQNVNYGDYLRRVRADIFYYTTQENKNFANKQGQNELNYNKRTELDAAEKSAYAEKIANQKKITVSDQEITDAINAQLKSNNTDEAALSRTLKTYYDWSLSEYRDAIRSQILVKKVSFAVDSAAKNKAENFIKQLKNGADFAKLAGEKSDDKTAAASGGEISGKMTDQNALFQFAKNMKIGEISDPVEFTAGDGNLAYAVVKLEEKSDDDLKIRVIQVNLSQFANDFQKLRADGKIHENINVPRDESFAK